MDLRERVYSVLIVSAGESMNSALSALMPMRSYYPLRFVSSIASAKREWSEHIYDFLIINSPLPDDIGIRFAIDAVSSSSSVVLMFVRSELEENIRDQLFGTGVLTLAKPVNRLSLAHALSWMSAIRERLRKLEKKSLSFEEKMQEIRLVNRAKWVLISVLKLDEPQAHRYIEKQAMDRCISRKEIAEEIIRTYS